MDNDPQKDLPSTLDVETQESQLSEIPLSDIPLELPTTEPNKPESKPLSLFQRLKNVFFAFLPIGYITFGGPAAHVAIYQEAFVHKRNWVNEAQFSELFALGQSLPGPTSTQVLFCIVIDFVDVYCHWDNTCRCSWRNFGVTFICISWICSNVSHWIITGGR